MRALGNIILGLLATAASAGEAVASEELLAPEAQPSRCLINVVADDADPCPIITSRVEMKPTPNAGPDQSSTTTGTEIAIRLDTPSSNSSLTADDHSLFPQDYSGSEFIREVWLVPKKNLGVIAGTLAIGALDWKWGQSKFHFSNEGWFGRDTTALGMDKLGHAHGTASIADGVTLALRSKVSDPKAAALTGSIYAMGVMTFVEIADGTSDYGFSANDIVADAAGATFAYFRNTIPGLKEKVDYRFEYMPSGNGAYRPWSDYSGQKYLFAFKLAGWKKFESSPLRLLEIHAGYYARGFTSREESRGDPLYRKIFFGIGLNVEQLLFGKERGNEGGAKGIARELFRHVQTPYTYTETTFKL